MGQSTPDTAAPPHLLIVGGGLDLPDRARACWPGLRTSVICRQEVLPVLRSPERIERLVVLRRDAPVREWTDAARYIDRMVTVDRIANYTERDTDKTAAIGQALGLATTSAQTYHLVADKVAMRRRLAEAGVDDTPAGPVRTADDVRRFGARVGYPLICKPVAGVGSRGVRRICDPRDIGPALAWGEACLSTLDCAELMVEPFHRGTEFSVEALSEDGRHAIACVTRKFSEPAHFVEVGHVLPAVLDRAVASRIEDCVTSMLDALGVTNGVTHTEVIVTGDRVRVVETHLRPAGDQIPYLLAHISGIDLVDALARQSVGISAIRDVSAKRERLARQSRFAAIWYSCPDLVGQVTSVEGVESALAVPGVREVEVLIGPGKWLSGLAASSSRAAYAWAVGSTADEACERARRAVGRLRFSVSARHEGSAHPARRALDFDLCER